MSSQTPKSAEPSTNTRLDGAARRLTRRGLLEASAGVAAAAIVSRPALAQEGDNLPPAIPEWQWDPLESTCRHASLSIL